MECFLQGFQFKLGIMAAEAVVAIGMFAVLVLMVFIISARK